MSVFWPPSLPFEATVDFGVTGLTGTLGVRIIDNVGNEVLARTTAGVLEDPAGSALYQVTLTAPAFEGQYSLVWDDGTVGPGHVAIDDLVITSDAPVTVVGAPGSDLGPCTAWLTADDVAACCASVEATDSSIFDVAVAEAQELLFQLSGRLYAGLCEKTVRPCWTNCACPWQVLSRGHIVWNDNLYWAGGYGSWWCDDAPCGCRPLSKVHLSGYPVQEITGVLIDGVAVDPVTYRLDRKRELVRVRDPADPDTVLTWPGCQNLDLDDSQEGTWSVSYTFGRNPPSMGIAAASQLACELYKACAGQSCALPSGTTQVTRQGITIVKPAFTGWAWAEGRIAGQTRGWHTGMTMVDAFLNAYNPSALKRRPTIWAPSQTKRYAQSVGS